MEIVLTESAKKELFKISKGNTQAGRQIKIFLKKLESVQNPLALSNVKKLGGESAWRFRVGDYRLKFHFVNDEITISQILEIYKIAHRREVYD